MKISSKIHGIIDYLLAAFLWIGPSFFGLFEASTYYAYILGSFFFILALCTNYEFGVVKFLPFKYHGKIEGIAALALIIIGIYLKTLDGLASLSFFGGIGLGVLFLYFLSDYNNKLLKNMEVPYIESNEESPMI